LHCPKASIFLIKRQKTLTAIATQAFHEQKFNEEYNSYDSLCQIEKNLTGKEFPLSLNWFLVSNEI